MGMETIKQLEKEIKEGQDGISNIDVEDAKLETLKGVLKKIEELKKPILRVVSTGDLHRNIAINGFIEEFKARIIGKQFKQDRKQAKSPKLDALKQKVKELPTKCVFCGNKEVTNTITDKETLKEIEICEECFNTIYG